MGTSATDLAARNERAAAILAGWAAGEGHEEFVAWLRSHESPSDPLVRSVTPFSVGPDRDAIAAAGGSIGWCAQSPYGGGDAACTFYEIDGLDLVIGIDSTNDVYRVPMAATPPTVDVEATSYDIVIYQAHGDASWDRPTVIDEAEDEAEDDQDA